MNPTEQFSNSELCESALLLEKAMHATGSFLKERQCEKPNLYSAGRNPSSGRDIDAACVVIKSCLPLIEKLLSKKKPLIIYVEDFVQHNEREVDRYVDEKIGQFDIAVRTSIVRSPDEVGKGVLGANVFSVDPLDGTGQYLSFSNLWASGIALLENGRPVVSSIYNAQFNELYTGLLVRERNRLIDSMVYRRSDPNAKQLHLASLSAPTEFPVYPRLIGSHMTRSSRAKYLEAEPSLRKINAQFDGVVMSCSGLVSLCDVVAGRLAGYINNYTYTHDVAPAEPILIAGERKLSSFTGNPIDYSNASRINIVSSGSELIHSNLLTILNPTLK